MLYEDDKSVALFLDEMSANYNRLIDSVVMRIDDELLLVNIVPNGFKLDDRIKRKDYKVFKSRTICHICKDYRRGCVSKSDAIKAIKSTIYELAKEVEKYEKKNG